MPVTDFFVIDLLRPEIWGKVLYFASLPPIKLLGALSSRLFFARFTPTVPLPTGMFDPTPPTEREMLSLGISILNCG